jgi:hypothetical protein
MRRQLEAEMNAFEAEMDASDQPEPEPEARLAGPEEVKETEWKRFDDLGTGILRDSETSLQWTQRGSDARINWKTARDYCAQQTVGGVEDWRLPTIDELEAIHSGHLAQQPCGDAMCRIDSQFDLDGPWVWSSTKADVERAWVFDYLAGDRYSVGREYQLERALCVRGR